MRTKKAPKRSTREKSTAKVRYGHRIDVSELWISDEIVTTWEYDPKTGARQVSKSFKVDTIEECPSQWRTHIHVNGQYCYDTRTPIDIVTK